MGVFNSCSPWIKVDIFIICCKCKVITVIARNTSSIFPFTTLCKVGKQLWMANTPQASASLVHHSKDNKLLRFSWIKRRRITATVTCTRTASTGRMFFLFRFTWPRYPVFQKHAAKQNTDVSGIWPTSFLNVSLNTDIYLALVRPYSAWLKVFLSGRGFGFLRIFSRQRWKLFPSVTHTFFDKTIFGFIIWLFDKTMFLFFQWIDKKDLLSDLRTRIFPLMLFYLIMRRFAKLVIWNNQSVGVFDTIHMHG